MVLYKYDVNNAKMATSIQHDFEDNSKVLSFVLKDLVAWNVDDVKLYATIRAKSLDCSIGFTNRITEVLSFIDAHSVDGLKLNWLISQPFETAPNTNDSHVAGKLKNLDPKLWKGVRWKDLLEPIINIHDAPKGTRMELRAGVSMVLVQAEGIVCADVSYSYDRVYSMKTYDGPGH
tara:strand:+ start:5598 stop:6125 length:528 start_codon:yes stop_codon:yes gene_type:complete